MYRLIIVFLFFSPVAHAAGAMNTFDFFNYVEQKFQSAETHLIHINEKINNMYAVQRIRNQLMQIEQGRQQLDRLRRQYEALTGKYGYGRWLDGPALLLSHKDRPESREELLRLLREGHATGEMADDRNAWVNVYLPPDPKAGRIERRDTPETSQQRNLIDTTMALDLQADALFRKAKGRADAIENIRDKMDETENMKQSMDLMNANMLVLNKSLDELLYIQTMMAKREAAESTGTIIQNKTKQEYMQW